MSEMDYARERYSICIADEIKYESSTYYKYYRIADFDPKESPGELAPALVESHCSSPEEAIANPDHLYNPMAASNHDRRDSDFYLFRWRLDPSDAGKQLTRSFHDDPALLGFPEPREVIMAPGMSSEADLRTILSEGIPFNGKTTGIFYIAYEREGDDWHALKCSRKDFLFRDGTIKIPSSLTNARGTILSAPHVRLKGYDIIESPFPATAYRKVYASLNDIEPDGRVLLRPLSYYAADYVKWFVNEESLSITKSNKSAINKVIASALSRPDALERYLDAQCATEEIEALELAIRAAARDEEDNAKTIIRSALLKDEQFRQECTAQAMAENDAILEEKRREISDADDLIETAKETLSSLEEKRESLGKDNERLRNDLARLNGELDEAISMQDKVLEEIQSNIALRLGLRSVAAIPPSRDAVQNAIHIECGSVLGVVAEGDGFESVLSNNLRQLGVTSVSGNPAEERKKCVQSAIGALSATNCLAVPYEIAREFADALCVCLSGRRAKRIVVAADCRDIGGVLDALSGDDAVALVDNVIDAVNEGVLFAVLSSNVKPIVVFSVGSHASAQLLAKEIWGKLFLPAAESLVTFSQAARADRMQCLAGGFSPARIPIDDALEGAADLASELESLYMQASPLFLSGIVLRATEGLAGEDPVEHYISQHLLISSPADAASYRVLSEWSEDDKGLAELAKKLGINGR